ncbi:hypothetical protein GCM10025868_33070 [Angustibacter aerolatus]|uniref:Twin-arginine translocation signal domain-containing protein n=1 Tax=Angustibacter aerolatus TaxID=1162965 RepID=A0ABQ6JJW1_9ACTN|nr:hypothetical protein [Angustibacter aerolatus]GMA88057.1 hypothetical protein GCM10025868_33070 [Angustibacter aerolatus]
MSTTTEAPTASSRPADPGLAALEAATAPGAGPVSWLVGRVAKGLDRLSRRGFLAQTAVVGSAIALDPKGYVLMPGTAYASVCGPDTKASAGYTVMCCTVNGGKNSCPPGTFTAGWWKAADSSWCCGGYRYIVDCNATCSDCSSGCSGDHICDSRCWSLQPAARGRPGSATSGGTAATRSGTASATRTSGAAAGSPAAWSACVAPYKWDNCTTTSLVDDATAEHNAPCLQGCGPILERYDAIGAQGSVLGASQGPERAVGDDRGRYVVYAGGRILHTRSTGAWEVHGASLKAYLAVSGPKGCSATRPAGG